MKYLSTGEISKKWKISTTRITILAANNRIPGAIQVGGRWLIPYQAEKPTDGRNKKEENNIKETFRYPFFTGMDESSIYPPLTSDEMYLKKTFDAFCACEFHQAERYLIHLSNNTDNLYIKIPTLYAGCMIAFIQTNITNFLKYYSELTVILNQKFPYKKEMESFIKELDAIIGSGWYFNSEFIVDPTYQYHESFLPHLAMLSTLNMFYTNKNTITLSELNSYEISLKFVENSGSFTDAQAMHLYIGFVYISLKENEKANYHFIKALKLAEKYNLYWLPAVEYYYFGKSFEPAFKYFSKAFVNKIITNGTDIHKIFVRFNTLLSSNNIFSHISKNKYIYLYYAIKGYSNKEVADILNLSVKTIDKNYSDLYLELMVKNKRELVDYYFDAMKQNMFE